MTLISVVIPVYNGEKTIASTIASVLSQTHSELEILAIDDGSTDKTLDVIAEIADPRLRVFSFPNGGQATARNHGIERSLGEFVAFLDADDQWTPDKLSAQLAALQRHPQAAVAYSWTNYVDDRGRVLRRSSHVGVEGKVLRTLLLMNFIENGSNVLVRREALQAIDPFSPDLVPTEDWDLWLRLAETFEFVCVPRLQIIYRVAPHSQSANVPRLERSCRTCLERAYQRSPQHVDLEPRSRANLYKYLIYKILEGVPSDPQPRSRCREAWRLFRELISAEPSFWKQRISFKVLLWLAILQLTPGSVSRRWLDPQHSNRWMATSWLLGGIQHQP